MKIEVELPESVIAAAAVHAWKMSFGQSGDWRGGEGMNIVRGKVAEALESPELLAVVQRTVSETAATLVGGIVREEVATKLRTLVKRVVKEKASQETLLNQKEMPL